MLTIGVTGGIGSGKSLVCNFFSKRGINIVDADVVAREVVAPGTECLARITARFGPGILQTDGNLDRAALRQIVFRDTEQRQWLEAVTHPAIRSSIVEQLNQTPLPGPYQILCSPLLLEKQQDQLVDRILMVDVPEAVQIARASERDTSSEALIRSIMKAQLSREDRLARADDVVDNSGTPEHTYQQLETLHQYYGRQG